MPRRPFRTIAWSLALLGVGLALAARLRRKAEAISPASTAAASNSVEPAHTGRGSAPRVG